MRITIDYLRSMSNILLICTILFSMVGLFPLLGYPNYFFKISESVSFLSLRIYQFAFIILVLPAVFNIISDLVGKSSYIINGIFYRTILALLIILPNVAYLFYIEHPSKLSILVNVQTMIIFMVSIACFLSITDEPIYGSYKYNIILSSLFNTSVILINYSRILDVFSMLVTRAAAAFLMFCCIVILTKFANKRLLSRDIKLFQVFIFKSELLLKDQQFFFCLSSLLACSAGYFIYIIMLILGLDIESTLILLSNVQIICVYPILYLELRICKRVIFYSQLELESKKTFLRTTSHEIRTPMNTIVLGLNLLRKEFLEQGIFNEDLVEILDNLDGSSEVVLELVNDLLSHDKIKEGIMKLEKTPLSLWNLVQNTINPFRTQARQSGIILTVDSEAIPNIQNYFIDGDKHKLSQVFRNLLSNALKFTESGKRVSVRATHILDQQINCRHRRNSWMALLGRVKVGSSSKINEPQRFMQIDVVDEGAGISPENIGRLFKEIVQFNPAKLQGGKGSGLGMMITKGIIDLHGGKISVNSEGEGKGCTFTVLLPVYCNPNSSITQHQISTLFSVRVCSNSNGQSFLPPPISSTQNTAMRFHATGTSSRTLHPNQNMIYSQNIALSRSRVHSLNLGQQSPSSFAHSSFEGREDGEVSNALTDNDLNVIDRHVSSGLSIIDNQKVEGLVLRHLSEVVDEDQFDSISCPSPSLSLNNIQHRHSHRCSQSSNMALRFLVVDDTKLNRKMLCRLMRGNCLDIVEAENGFEAVEAVKISFSENLPFDVILIDSCMPVMDGLTATKAIRELGYTGLIIGVTGNVSETDYDDFLAHGANDVLSKPIQLPALDKIIMDYFGNSNDEQQLSQSLPLRIKRT